MLQLDVVLLACLLVLEIPPTYYYERVKSVLIYRGAYQWRQSRLQRANLGCLSAASHIPARL